MSVEVAVEKGTLVLFYDLKCGLKKKECFECCCENSAALSFRPGQWVDLYATVDGDDIVGGTPSRRTRPWGDLLSFLYPQYRKCWV